MKMRSCEIMQQLEFVNFNYIKNVLVERSEKQNFQYAYIVHDKDKKDDGTLKSPHFHIFIKFKSPYDSNYICKWFGVEEQYVSKIKGRWSDVLLYLTHKNAEDKYQYSDEEVFSNFDFVKAREEKKKNKFDERREEIVNLIDNGVIREYNYFEYINAVEYDKYKRSIENAFKYRLDKIKGVNRKMDVIFVTGDSGTGKTSYAKYIAEQKKYSVYVSSGSNDVLDDYKGQDCLILDDLRPSCMGLSDLLKMLDNNTTSSVKSRYKNKVLECKLIIITTTLSIDNFFSNVFMEEHETVVQLKRRCKIHVRITRDFLFTKVWNDFKRCYGQEIEFENPISALYKPQDLTFDDELNYMQDVLGLGVDLVNDIKNKYDKGIVEVHEQIEF